MKVYRYFIIAGFTVLLGAQFPKAIERQMIERIDFPIFFEAASHHGIAPGYLYPPFFAWALSPLAPLTEHDAASVWYVIHALAILSVLALSLPVQLPRGWINRLILLLVLLAAARLIILNAELGQVNAIILLLILLSFRVRNGAVAGGLAAVATLIKITPVLVLPFLLFGQPEKRWAIIAGFAATVVCGTALPLAFGYGFAGLHTLGALPSDLVGNLSPAAFLPRPLFYLLGFILAGGALFVGLRIRDRFVLLIMPLFLMIVLPQLVRKAHLLFGLPSILFTGEGYRVIRWAPACWAVGSLGTMAVPAAAPVGMVAALGCCFYGVVAGNPRDAAPRLPD